jgi:uncharacterized tellurite resistance protein B-like protein
MALSSRLLNREAGRYNRARPAANCFSREANRTMLKRLKVFIADLSGDTPAKSKFSDDDYRLAATALMVHAIEIDGITKPEEKSKLRDILRLRFSLSDSELVELIDKAHLKDQEAVDLYGFTSVLTRKFDQNGRQRIVRLLWEIVLADQEVHEFEDNFIWRVAELLGVSTRDRIRMRKQIEAGVEGDPGPLADDGHTDDAS